MESNQPVWRASAGWLAGLAALFIPVKANENQTNPNGKNYGAPQNPTKPTTPLQSNCTVISAWATSAAIPDHGACVGALSNKPRTLMQSARWFLVVLWRRLKRVGWAVVFGRVPPVLNPAKSDRGFSDQFFPFRCEWRSLGEAHGRMSAMEYVIKVALRRRFSRRVNMTARRNPVNAPSSPFRNRKTVECAQALACQKESCIRHRDRP